MFTGIITDIGVVTALEEREKDRRLSIATAWPVDTIEIGASVCCSGCCLTVTETGMGGFSVDISAETISRSTAGSWTEGAKINLERSLKMGDELGGHLVSGHVDALAELVSVEQEGESRRMTFKVPGEFAKYVAPKGSVALDGISLTVNEVEGNVFGINIIPHTWKKTTLFHLEPGGKVNFEADMLARYVARILSVEAA